VKDFFIRLISDEKGNLSSARLINLGIAICGCLISWKLVLLGGYNETYFGLLLAYGGGVYGYGKKLERPKEEEDPSLKPPKG